MIQSEPSSARQNPAVNYQTPAADTAKDEDPIVIIGMGIRLSGGVNSPDDFWDALLKGKHGLCEVPGTRYNIDTFYDAHLPHSIRTRKGYYLEQDPTQFDADFFEIKAVEAAGMDPQQRQLLEVTWECLESAGQTGSNDKNVGCYVGVFGNDWLNLDSQDDQAVDRFHISGAGPFALSNRLSYCFDWYGPSITMQTACSSSLIALHDACLALQHRECRSAVVAGVNLILSPTMTIAMSDTNVMSPDGACKTFDQAANGYGRGEGVSVVYIKRLSDAIKDNDCIRAIIRATSTNYNGKTPIPTAPCLPSQESLIKQAYRRAGIQDATQTALFECHGTGTQIGDVVEVTAIARVLAANKETGDSSILSSTKPNFGHTEGASGLTSVIKAILCLEHDTIPPNIFFKTPNERAPFAQANLVVPTRAMPFPKNKQKRVSINCFGVGGSNAHTILDGGDSLKLLQSQTPKGGAVAAGDGDAAAEARYLFVLSAKDNDALEGRIAALTDYVEHTESSLKDIAYTLACRRQHFAQRAFAVAHPRRILARSDFHLLSTRPVQMVWVFTGQGSQWAGMAKQLIETNGEFRADMEALNTALHELDDGPTWNLSDELCKLTEEGSRVNETEMAQPLCTALAIGIVNQLQRWGLRPSSVLGHSSGEMAAAYASGAISSSSAIKIAYYRGIVAKSQEGKGGMTAVGLGAEQVSPFLRNTTVEIACKNSPSSVVISGTADELDAVTKQIKHELPEVFCRKLRVNVAYHSKHMKQAAVAFEQLITPHIELNGHMIPMHSTSSSSLETITTPSSLHAQYWSHGMASEVQFEDAVRDVIMKEGPTSQLIMLEIGPHSALSGPLRQIFQSLREDTAPAPGREPLYVPTLTRNDMDASSQLLTSVGRLHCLGVPMDMSSVTGLARLVPNLGAYPWKRKAGSRESRMVRDWRLRTASHHELLGARVTAMPEAEPAWRNMLKPGSVLWLGDHVLRGNTVFPVAGYVAMAGAACKQLDPSCDAYSVRRLSLKSLLTMEPGKTVEILTTFRPARYNDLAESEWYLFTISSHNGKMWTKHCTGEVRAARRNGADDTTTTTTTTHRPQVYSRRLNAPAWYKTMRSFGYEYGPSLRNLEDISADPVDAAAVGTIATPGHLQDDAAYLLHPSTIDHCLQLMGVAAVQGLSRRVADMQVPFSIGEIHVTRGAESLRAWVKGVDDGNRSLCWEATAVDQDGKASLTIANLRSAVLDRFNKSDLPIPLLTTPRWEPLLDLLPANQILLPPTHPSSLDGTETAAASVRSPSFKRFLALLGHVRPTMHVLQVGGSSSVDDDATTQVVADLTSPEGVPLFSSYTYTHASNVALDAARLQFNDDPNITFKLFHPDRDTKKQGLEPQSFDLVIALKAGDTQTLASLQVLQTLLKPDGWLLLNDGMSSGKESSETNEEIPAINDGSAHHSYALPDWGMMLTEAGFHVVSSSLVKHESPSDPNPSPVGESTFVCKPLLESSEPLPGDTGSIILLSDSDSTPWGTELAACLTARGYSVSWSMLADRPTTQTCPVISLLDVDAPSFHNLSEPSFYQLRDYILSTQAQHTLWVTKNACQNPEYGLAHGLLRTLRREIALAISIVEFPCFDTNAIASIVDIQKWIQQQTNCCSRVNHDYEFISSGGIIHICRHHWVSPSLSLADNPPISTSNVAKSLHLPDRLLEDCTWIPSSVQPDLGVDQVEVDICYLGLNFRDVMIAMAFVGNRAQFGLEASGVVHRVGASVSGFQPGDRVGILGSGLCHTKVAVASDTCWKIPDRLSLEDAAVIMVPYLTAMYSLIHVGNLKRNQTVLIHSACGGVGLAAIRICQAVGAKIYATVGSEEKIDYLVEHCSLSRDDIFNSRDDSFVQGVIKATSGKGVDLVLNSLAAKLLHASWQCVASFGKMIELGKIDFSTNASLSMTPFAKNRAFIGVDLLDLASERPDLLRSLLQDVLAWFQDGRLDTVHPLNIFEAAKTSDALRRMQQGQHIGRLLLKMPSNSADLPGPSFSPGISFRADASYILVGGLGGLGRTVANWIVENGAREIVFIGRSAGQSSDDEAFLEELAVQGCNTVCIAGSIAKPETIKMALAACGYPLRGIIHMSATLRDRTFQNMTHQEWTECLESKVEGTLNIHRAVQNQDPLDFFVLFGSLAGTCGNSGQANYAAANTFLESLAQFRRRQGQACSVLHLGPVEDVGMMSRDAKLLQTARAASIRLLSEDEVLQGLRVAIAQSLSTEQDCGSARILSSRGIVNVGLSITKPVSDPSVRNLWVDEARFAMYSNLQQSNSDKKPPQPVDAKFRDLVKRIEEDPLILKDPETELLVCRELGRLITGYLGDGSPMNDDELAGITIDSLMAIEIKDWVRGNMNMDIGMDQTSRAKNVGELARYTIERLQVTYGIRKEEE